MRYTDTLPTRASKSVNKMLRNTYGLLSLTLLFSALTAGMSLAYNLSHPGLIITLVGFYGLLFLTHKFKNSSIGILCVFALTGFIGLTLGPILNAYLNMSNGDNLIISAFGITGLSFLALSGYVIFSKKDFSFLNGFVTVGFFVLLLAIISGIFIHMTALQIFISGGSALFSAAVIMLQTSEIIHGGETNYIMATITLYVSLYNMFLGVLSLLGIANDD